MAKADWSQESQGAESSWDEAAQGATSVFTRNQDLTDAKAAALTYNDADTAYSSSDVFYNGYDPTGLTAESQTNATWDKVDD